MTLHELRDDLANAETFEKGNQFEIDLDIGTENDGFRRGANRVFDLVRPNVLHGLEEQTC